jgi:hypothetical protein
LGSESHAVQAASLSLQDPEGRRKTTIVRLNYTGLREKINALFEFFHRLIENFPKKAENVQDLPRKRRVRGGNGSGGVMKRV